MSTVELPPPPPPVVAVVLAGGAEAAVVLLSLLPPPQAARPRAATAATLATTEARLIEDTFRSSPVLPTVLRRRTPIRFGQSPWNSGVWPSKKAVTPRFRS